MCAKTIKDDNDTPVQLQPHIYEITQWGRLCETHSWGETPVEQVRCLPPDDFLFPGCRGQTGKYHNNLWLLSLWQKPVHKIQEVIKNVKKRSDF